MMRYTLAIIKPVAVSKGYTGQIINIIELNGFDIKRIEKRQFSQDMANNFYQSLKDKPFFKELVDNMSNKDLILMILEKDNAVEDWRSLMGHTDPLKANLGTLRRMFGESISYNAVHGSDSDANAIREIDLIFPGFL
jgi:nucleoside-diphosphate kinase